MSDPGSRLRIEADGDRLIVAGEIDAHTAGELSSALEPLPGTGDVHIDVAGVGFMDSSGLRTLISGHQAAEAEGRRLVIERPSKSVTRIIEISGLLEHFNIVPAD